MKEDFYFLHRKVVIFTTFSFVWSIHFFFLSKIIMCNLILYTKPSFFSLNNPQSNYIYITVKTVLFWPQMLRDAIFDNIRT